MRRGAPLLGLGAGTAGIGLAIIGPFGGRVSLGGVCAPRPCGEVEDSVLGGAGRGGSGGSGRGRGRGRRARERRTAGGVAARADRRHILCGDEHGGKGRSQARGNGERREGERRDVERQIYRSDGASAAEQRCARFRSVLRRSILCTASL